MKIKENILNIFNLAFSKKEILEISRPEFDQKVYVSLEYALEEIEKRRRDKELIKKIESYIEDIPDPFNFGVNAVLFRSVATPQFEIKRFFDLSTGYNIRPLFWEYYDDKFHSGNMSKYTLGKLFVYKGMGKNNHSIVQKYNLIDFNKNNGLAMKYIQTIKGDNFIDFHHKLLERVIPNSTQYVFDSSDWLKKNGGVAKKYYKRYLALFLVHGILFENFLLDKSEIEFTKNVFIPAFEKVEKLFGIKPLIVALNPTDIEGSDFWNSYPQQIEDVI